MPTTTRPSYAGAIRRRSARFGLAALALSVALLPGCASGPYDLGRRSLDQGEPQQALDHFDAAIEAGQKVERARRERAAALLALGNTDEAIDELESLAATRLDDERLFWLLGEAHGKADDPAQAAAAYRRYEQLTRDPRSKDASRLRVAQLEHALSIVLADSLLEARRAGKQPTPRSVAVVGFLPPQAQANSAEGVELTLAERDARARRALVAFVSADLAKVADVDVIADDMMGEILSELELTRDNAAYFEQGTLLPVGLQQPAAHLVYGYFGGLDRKSTVMGALTHTDARGLAAVSDVDGEFSRLMEMETQVVLDVLSSMDVETSDEERLAIGDKPTRNLEAFLAFGEGLRLSDLGRHQEASAAFAQAARLDPGFTMAKKKKTSAQAAMTSAPVSVPAPPSAVADPGTAATLASGSLGMGLGPQPASTSIEASASTSDLTTVRGTKTLEVSGSATTGSGGNK